jgi:hypothetical protein
MKRIIVEVAGGCVQEVHNADRSDWILLDWDNLLGDYGNTGDTQRAWDQFDAETQAWIKQKYPDEYRQLQERIADDLAAEKRDHETK